MIRGAEQWNYSRALGVAIELHIAFSHAMNMDLHETAAFFEWLSNDLMPFLTGVEADLATSLQKAKTIHASFDERFDRNKDILINFCKTLWDALQEGAEFEEVSLSGWVRDMGVISRELKDAFEENRIEIPAWFQIAGVVDVREERQKLWSLYSSYVHMTNNRLGILNQDEAYVAYLISRCLKEFSPEHALETK